MHPKELYKKEMNPNILLFPWRSKEIHENQTKVIHDDQKKKMLR